MSDFLDRNNICGQTILKLVSRGNAIIAEILRLSEMVPPVFKLETREDTSKYGSIICDFSYFRVNDFENEFSKKLDNNLALRDRDEEFKDNFIEILTRFYMAFESVHKYAVDLNRFIEELEEGNYIQQTLETLLLNTDGKQLLSEALYLCGVMLLCVDQRMDGTVRERMLVSYYRYSAQKSTTSDSNIDDVCNLLRTTGFTASGKRPVNYPEDYFRRVKMNPLFISMVIGRLRADDVYNQINAFPLPEHRSVALANQAAMLYISLFFAPDILQSQPAIMREIVDKFFPDNWIVSVYMGTIVNLIDAWEPYKAAKQALNYTLEAGNLKDQAVRQMNKLVKLMPQVQLLLKEGALNEETVLEGVHKITNVVRECNASLRWQMLHTSPGLSTIEQQNKRCRQIKETVVLECKIEPLQVFRLLLFTAQLEIKVKEIYQQLLKEKESKWHHYKKESLERVTELSEVFSGSKPLTRIEKNVNLQSRFADIGKQIEELTFENSAQSSRKTVLIIQALEEVQEFHQLESNLQVKQFVTEVKKYLHFLLKTTAVKDDVLITLQIVGDLAYAWDIIDHYTIFMQQGIKKDPTLVIKLRATFLKLASALDTPLMRINQSGSSDLLAVSQYFSSELVAYVRKVLHIIPETMFGLMARIIELQTNDIKELPTRLMKDQLKQFAVLEQRHEVAKLTHAISVFTEGILMMKTTLVGIIQIDPKKLLEDGIRKELVHQVADSLHKGLVFNPKAKSSELIVKLEALSQVMDGFRRSFEYIQDYVCIYGLKIWQEEVSRIVNFNIEQECNSFVRQKVLDFESIYQSRTAPIPRYPPLDPYSVNFVGRLAREILRITEPKQTIYVHQLSTWYDYRTHQELVNPRLFSLMMCSIGTAGVNGLDKLLSFMIMAEMQNIKKYIERDVLRDKSWMEQLNALNAVLEEKDDNGIIGQPAKVYLPVIERASRSLLPINDALMRVGQMQIIRCCIAHELNTSCKFQSRHLASTLQTFNDSLINEIEKKGGVREDTPLLYELSNYLEWTGISDPLAKIYVPTKATPYLDLVAFVLVVMQMNKFIYAKSVHGLLGKRSTDACDGVPFVIGFLSFLKQYHEMVTRKFLLRSSQYVKSIVDLSSLTPSKTSELPAEVCNLLLFCDHFLKFGKIPRSFTINLPDLIFDQARSVQLTK
ncbi:hypothetical protein HDE_12453 [Halotydeus destructor]|nr:hypothetical protein HDE_12453 [Halotydeus destructor]